MNKTDNDTRNVTEAFRPGDNDSVHTRLYFDRISHLLNNLPITVENPKDKKGATDYAGDIRSIVKAFDPVNHVSGFFSKSLEKFSRIYVQKFFNRVCKRIHGKDITVFKFSMFCEYYQ